MKHHCWRITDGWKELFWQWIFLSHGVLYFWNFSNKLRRTITRQLWQVKIRSTVLRLTTYPVINYLSGVSYRSCLSRRKNRAGGHRERWIRPAKFMNALRCHKTEGIKL